MKILNKVIIVILIIIGILVGILLIFNSNNNQQNNNKDEINEVGKTDTSDSTPYELESLKDDNVFFLLADIVQIYYDNLNKENIVGYEREERAEYIYNILTPNYIKKNNINQDKVFEVVKEMEREVKYTPLSAKVKVEDGYTIYSITGLVEDEQDGQYLGEESFFFYVNNKSSFAMEPIEKDTNIEEIETYDIENNNYNKFQVEIMSVQKMVDNYMTNYKKMMLYYPERAFNLLDESYRNTRFGGDVNQYKEYINKNQEQLRTIRLAQYLDNTYDNHTEYVCKDQYENYYIFDVTASMQYTLKLDNYTILTSKFKEEYNKATDIVRVKMNIERFVQMLNNYDYETAYNLLDNTFRTNNFPSVDDFEAYIKSYYFQYNDVTYNDYSKEGDVYIYKLVLSNKQGTGEGEGSEMNIIMKLREGTDFVMSFEIRTMEDGE